MPDLSVAERTEPVVEGDPEHARREAGRVRPLGEDVVWVLADLAPALAGVQVFSVWGESESLRDSEFRWDVGGVAIDLHVWHVADADRLAGMFGLECADKVRKEGRVWRTWRGWDVDASRCGFPVCLRITASVGSVPS